jgi:hypothetical protein
VGTVILTDGWAQRQTSEVGRESATSQKGLGLNITSISSSGKKAWRNALFTRNRDSFFRKKIEGKISIFLFVEKSVYERIIVEIIAPFYIFPSLSRFIH